MRYSLVLLLAGWGGLGWLAPAFAHGAKIEYQQVSSIEIQARYDSGEPMKAAQVTVYAPNNPTEPWMTSTTDDEGRFVFVPDTSQAGNWEVMVRQAGHGDILSIPVTPGAEAASGGDAIDSPRASLINQTGQAAPIQPWLSIVAVVWGFIGTALFFARGKR